MNMHRKFKNILVIFTVCLIVMAGNAAAESSKVKAAAARNGWIQSNGIWYYYQNGSMVKNGWAKDSHGWCFLNAIDGSWVQTGWAKDSHGWGYIQNGYWVEHEAWVKDSHGWCFMGSDGYWIDHAYYVYDTQGICIIGTDGYWTEERLPAGSDMPIAYIKLNKTSDTIYVGKTDILKAEAEPYNAVNKSITWTTSNPSVATVDSAGNVTAVGVGNTVVTATSSDESVSAKCTYTVEEEPALTLDQVAENGNSVISILSYSRSSILAAQIDGDVKPMPYAIGSGTVVSADGKILTSYHLIEGAFAVFAVTKDSSVYQIDGVLGYDKSKDIAVLKLKDATNFPASIMGDSDATKTGDQIVSIGHSADSEVMTADIAQGSVSGMGASVTTLRTGIDIKITAQVDQGYAGGGLYNMKGKLIGINYAVKDGSSFAIPINEFKSLMDGTTLTPVSELYKLYKAEVPDYSEIKNVNGDGNTLTINFQPYFYDSSREIMLNINKIYTGDEANAIVKSESTYNSEPGSDQQWIVMNIFMANRDPSGIRLKPSEVLVDNYFMQDGTPLPVLEVAAFEGERSGQNITDVSLGAYEGDVFWFGILVNKTQEPPLLRIGTGYNPDTLETTYSWYSTK